MSGDSSFTVYSNPNAKRRLHELFEQATIIGKRDHLLHVWKLIVANLERDPVAFGEPRHRTKLSGGMVYQRVFMHCVVDYVVYQQLPFVLVTNIRLLKRFYDASS